VRRSAIGRKLRVCKKGARGARSKTRPPALERGRVPLVADGTYLGPVKAGRHVDDRAVNASA